MTFEELGKLARAKEAERRAKLTPEERAEEDRRREEYRRAEEEEYLAKKDATVPLLEYEQDIREYESTIGYLISTYEDKLDNQAGMALDKLQAQETELKVARARIDALLDANLKAQDMRRQLDALQAQGDRIEGKVRDIDKHNQQAESYLGIMPDHEELGEIRKAVRKHIDEKKMPGISKETAARIFKTFYPDPRGIYKKLTEHTIGDWLKAGKMKKTDIKIDETALASKISFLQWIISNCHEIGIEVHLPKTAREKLKDL